MRPDAAALACPRSKSNRRGKTFGLTQLLAPSPRPSRKPGLGRQERTRMQANLRKALVAVALITPAPSAFADVIADWNEKAIAFVTPRMTPPAAQRVVAMVQIAMFDAINSIERRYRPYLAQLPTPTTASKDAAAAAAAGSVLAGLHPQ